MAGHRLFRKKRPERQGGGVAQYVRKQQEYVELCLGQTMTQLRTWRSRLEGRWIWMWWWVTAVVCLVRKPPFSDYQKKKPHIHMSWSLWEAWTTPVSAERQRSRTQQSRRFLECVNNRSLTQGTEDPAHSSALLGLILANKDDQVGKEKVWGSEQSSVCLKHKPAKTSQFQGSDHLLEVRCVFKSFPGSGPLLAINTYPGKTKKKTPTSQIGYNASKEQIVSWVLHIHYCALT